MPKTKAKSTAKRKNKVNNSGVSWFSPKFISAISACIFVIIFGALGYHIYQNSRAATGTQALVSGVNAAGNWCMHDTDANAGGTDGSLAPGNPINVRACSGNPDEYFAFSGGKIKFGADGAHCIQPKAGGITAATTIVLQPCNGNATQDWAKESNGSFKNTYASTTNKNWPQGLCLAVTDGDTSQTLSIEACNNAGQQRWTAQTFGSDGAFLSYAEQHFTGVPYLLGGGHSEGFAAFHRNCPTPTSGNAACQVDCSSLVSYTVDAVMGTSWDWTVDPNTGLMDGSGNSHWHAVSLSNLQPGDIVTRPDHVEIFAYYTSGGMETFGAHHAGTTDGLVFAGTGYYNQAFQYE